MRSWRAGWRVRAAELESICAMPSFEIPNRSHKTRTCSQLAPFTRRNLTLTRSTSQQWRRETQSTQRIDSSQLPRRANTSDSHERTACFAAASSVTGPAHGEGSRKLVVARSSSRNQSSSSPEKVTPRLRFFGFATGTSSSSSMLQQGAG